jgi:hypothetical protein
MIKAGYKDISDNISAFNSEFRYWEKLKKLEKKLKIK